MSKFTWTFKPVPRAIFVAALLLCFSAYQPRAVAADGAVAQRDYQRVISLSPSTSEILFALGLGRSVVGVTKFCTYPPEAATRERVGGYIDPSYEIIVALDPDVVILLPEQAAVKENLLALGIETVTVNNKRVEDILSSISFLGAVFGKRERAAELERELRKRVAEIKERTAGLRRPAVVMSVARGMGSLGIKSVYVAGRGSYFDELVEIAGGVNAYRGERIKFPKVSLEGLIAMNPDVVIDLVPSLKERGWNKDEILGEWSELQGIKAVEEARVYVLGESYVTVPGPRFILLLEDIAEAIHPYAGVGGTEKKGARSR